MGNPHAVQRVAEVELAPVTSQGPRSSATRAFPSGVNAGYMQVLDRATTSPCASGSAARARRFPAAPAPAPRRWRRSRRSSLDSPVRVDTRGGTLTISWAGGDNAVWMKGPAETAFEGTLDI